MLLFIQSVSAYSRKPHTIGHVAISLGNGYLLEARGSRYSVTIGPLRPSFNLACKVQELYAPRGGRATSAEKEKDRAPVSAILGPLGDPGHPSQPDGPENVTGR